jgi:hypothetical protein
VRCRKRSTKRKSIAINAHILKEQRPQVKNITLHYKELEREEQTQN